MQPFISEKVVRAALDSLLYSARVPQQNPLEALLMIDDLLMRSALPDSDRTRLMALHEVLVEIIMQQYDKHCRSADLLPLSPEAIRSGALSHLPLLAKTGSAELLGWGVLYLRYACTHLNFMPADLSAALHVDVRTVQRYEAHGVRRLTELLIRREADIRHQLRERRLISALPTTTPVHLFGRADAMMAADAMLQAEGVHRLYVSGAGGVGKTVFVQEWLRRLIIDGQLDRLIWLDQPSSIQIVRDQLGEWLPLQSDLSLRDFVAVNRVALVLDGIQSLLSDPSSLCSLLVDIDAALVCLIDPVYVALPVSHLHLPLSDLTETATEQLIQATLAPQDAPLAADFYPVVRERVGGNPQAVIWLTRSLMFYDELSSEPALEQIYSHLYALLDADLKRSLFTLLLLPNGEVDAAALRSVWGMLLGERDLGDLARAHLIEVTDVLQRRYLLTNPARHFLQTRLTADSTVRPLLRDLLQRLDQRMAEPPLTDLLLDSVEYLLGADWLSEVETWRVRWLRCCWDAGLERGGYARWRSLLAAALADTADPLLYVAYGVCLRRFAEWEAAHQAFEWASAAAGEAGDFATQARALIERSVLFRYQGHYDRCLHLLERAKHGAFNLGDEALQQRWLLEQAQVAVDRRAPAEALAYLSSLPETGRVLALRGESALLLGEFQEAQQLAERVLAGFGDRQSAEARLHTLLGRSSEQRGDYETAYRYFAMALTRFEQSEDYFALARGQCNLGAVAIQLKRYDEADALLTQAEIVLSRLGDQVALMSVRHNLRLVRTYLSR